MIIMVSSSSRTQFFLMLFAISTLMAVSAKASVVVLPSADYITEDLVAEPSPKLILNGDDSSIKAAYSDSGKFDDYAAGRASSGQGYGTGGTAFRGSLAQADSSFAPPDKPFWYHHVDESPLLCPVPLDECVLPTTDYSQPLAIWELRSGRSFAPSQTSTTDAGKAVTTNCCLCDIARVCFSSNGDYLGEAIGDRFPDYAAVLSGWCFALQDHFHELFDTADDSNYIENDALIACRWLPSTSDRSFEINSTSATDSGTTLAGPSGPTPATDESRAMTVTTARSPADQLQHRAADSDDKENDFETYISKLESDEGSSEIIVTTSSEGGVIIDYEHDVSDSEDEIIDSNTDDVVQSNSDGDSSDINATASNSYDNSDSDEVAAEGDDISNESAGHDDGTVDAEDDNSIYSTTDDSDRTVEETDKNDNGDSNGDDDGDIDTDDGDEQSESSTKVSDSSAANAPTTTTARTPGPTPPAKNNAPSPSVPTPTPPIIPPDPTLPTPVPTTAAPPTPPAPTVTPAPSFPAPTAPAPTTPAPTEAAQLTVSPSIIRMPISRLLSFLMLSFAPDTLK